MLLRRAGPGHGGQMEDAVHSRGGIVAGPGIGDVALDEFASGRHPVAAAIGQIVQHPHRI